MWYYILDNWTYKYILQLLGYYDNEFRQKTLGIQDPGRYAWCMSYTSSLPLWTLPNVRRLNNVANYSANLSIKAKMPICGHLHTLILSKTVRHFLQSLLVIRTVIHTPDFLPSNCHDCVAFLWNSRLYVHAFLYMFVYCLLNSTHPSVYLCIPCRFAFNTTNLTRLESKRNRFIRNQNDNFLSYNRKPNIWVCISVSVSVKPKLGIQPKFWPKLTFLPNFGQKWLMC